MDPRLFPYYESELAHLQEVGAEFAARYPKVAGRLGLDQFECPDPHVERLLQGFAFLTARIQLKLDAQFPRFTSHLLQAVYPHLTAPTPSMTIVRFEPNPYAGNLTDGYQLPRKTALRSFIGNGMQTPCEYRTAHDVTLWPLAIRQADYLPSAGAVNALVPGGAQGAKAGLRVRLSTLGGVTMDELSLDRLCFFLQGVGALPALLLEQILSQSVGLAVRPAGRGESWQMTLPATAVTRRGYTPDEALLPVASGSFDGYRLLQEYFALPSRFMFFEAKGLQPALKQCASEELDLIFLFNRANSRLFNAVDASNFALFCTPAINLFEKRADRIHLNTHDTEFHLVPDRTRPMDFEVHSVQSVTGYGSGVEQIFTPFYSIDEKHNAQSQGRAFFSVQRRPAILPRGQRRRQNSLLSGYVGSDIFLSLVDTQEQPYRHSLRQLGATVLCTNRHLPIEMPEPANGHFDMAYGAPVASVRKMVVQSKPFPPIPEAFLPHQADDAQGSSFAMAPSWRLISHLSLNYLSLCDGGESKGASALRELLSLYAPLAAPEVAAQIDGIRHVETKAIVRRVPNRTALLYARGLEVAVTLDELAYEGSGTFVLGSVLAEFFAKYVSVNSFTETVTRGGRGEICRWPARLGRRDLL